MRIALPLLAILATCVAPARAEPEEPPPERVAPPTTPAPGRETPAKEPSRPAEPERKEPTAPAREAAADAKPAARVRRLGPNDPPASLGHLETTPPVVRKEIDDLIAILFNFESGREALEAKEQLAAIGKPAFLPLLGRMAAVRDTLTDDDTMVERMEESTLMLADQCLRMMDGFLDAKGKQVIRPGADRKYVKYILVLHFRRWKDGLGSTALKDLEQMPGPFDPAK